MTTRPTRPPHVIYQRAQFIRGTLIWDTEKKVQRRLEKKVNLFCLEEGYAYYRCPTLGEIARNEQLRAVWELAAGPCHQPPRDLDGLREATAG